MDNDTIMQGKWKGTYGYNVRKGFENANLAPVEFTLEIIASENGSFNGKVEDTIEMGGTPGVGQINGTVKDDLIVFEKNMPVHGLYFPNGERTVNMNKKHPTIIYSGKLEEDTVIQGTWKFRKPKFRWIGLLPWWYEGGSGTFRMEKTDK
jgi:hypothetical protein